MYTVDKNSAKLEQAKKIIICNSTGSVNQVISDSTSIVITTNIEVVVSLLSNEFDAEIEIHVPTEQAYNVVDTAIRFKVCLVVDGKELNLKKNKSKFKAGVELATIKALYATTAYDFKKELDYAINSLIRNISSITSHYKNVPDYHRTSASFNNRAGIAGV